jgi:hypothetical protein
MSSLARRMQSDETCVPIVSGARYRKCDTPCRRDTWRGRQARADRAPTSQKSRSANGSLGPACTGRVGLQTTAERARSASLADGLIVIDNAAEESASIIAPRGHCYSPAATISGGNLGNIFGRQVVSVIERCLIKRSVLSWINSANENNSRRCSNSAAGCRGQHLILRLQ